MANPNIATSSSIYGYTVGTSAATSSTDILTCSSNTVIKVNTLTAANTSASAVDVTVFYYDASAALSYYIAYTITVPAKTTLVVISKDTSIYLNESDVLRCTASTGSVLNMVCSYETIA